MWLGRSRPARMRPSWRDPCPGPGSGHQRSAARCGGAGADRRPTSTVLRRSTRLPRAARHDVVAVAPRASKTTVPEQSGSLLTERGVTPFAPASGVPSAPPASVIAEYWCAGKRRGWRHIETEVRTNALADEVTICDFERDYGEQHLLGHPRCLQHDGLRCAVRCCDQLMHRPCCRGAG